jgi:hypothetical protein
MSSLLRLEISLKVLKYDKPVSHRFPLPPKLQCLRLHECSLQVLAVLENIFEAKYMHYPCLEEIETVWERECGTPIVSPPGMDAAPTPEQWCLAMQDQGKSVGVNTRWFFAGKEKVLENLLRGENAEV